MIRRLRIRFVCVNMAIVTGMLCLVLALVLHSTRAGLAAESMRAMQSAALEPPGLTRPGQGPGGPAGIRCFTLRSGPAGELIASGGAFDLTDEDWLRQVLEAATAQGGREGLLEAYALRYCLSGPPGREVLVFADVSGELAAMSSLRRSCLLVGCAGFLGFLGLSTALARWAAGPVELAWRRQRQFVADASHELKTPLSVILTNAELLREPDRGEADRTRFAGNILTVARQMRGLVESLLELARMDGGQAPAMEPVDLGAVVSGALLPFEPVLFEAGLTLESQVEENLWVRGSGPRLGQVVDILLDNARKYALPGSQVSLCLTRAPGRSCLLRVTTAGEALSPQERRDVFRRFYRADPARSREGGYGLGLAIARSITAAHGGRIWAESGAGQNTFLVRLPCIRRPLPGGSGPQQ